MAGSHQSNFVFKTLNLEEQYDPYRNLWRNVLIVGIEDFLKSREIQIKFKNKKVSLEEIWFHHNDFNLVCEYAQLNPDVVRERIYEAIRKMEKHYDQKDMPEMSGKWFYKSERIHREPNRHSTTMYSVR